MAVPISGGDVSVASDLDTTMITYGIGMTSRVITGARIDRQFSRRTHGDFSRGSAGD